jgi:hypothetical protein
MLALPRASRGTVEEKEWKGAERCSLPGLLSRVFKILVFPSLESQSGTIQHSFFFILSLLLCTVYRATFINLLFLPSQ